MDEINKNKYSKKTNKNGIYICTPQISGGFGGTEEDEI